MFRTDHDKFFVLNSLLFPFLELSQNRSIFVHCKTDGLELLIFSSDNFLELVSNKNWYLTRLRVNYSRHFQTLEYITLRMGSFEIVLTIIGTELEAALG